MSICRKDWGSHGCDLDADDGHTVHQCRVPVFNEDGEVTHYDLCSNLYEESAQLVLRRYDANGNLDPLECAEIIPIKSFHMTFPSDSGHDADAPDRLTPLPEGATVELSGWKSHDEGNHHGTEGAHLPR